MPNLPPTHPYFWPQANYWAEQQAHLRVTWRISPQRIVAQSGNLRDFFFHRGKWLLQLETGMPIPLIDILHLQAVPPKNTAIPFPNDQMPEK